MTIIQCLEHENWTLRKYTKINFKQLLWDKLYYENIAEIKKIKQICGDELWVKIVKEN